jgi:cytochrome c oxidase cbb3-type subunit 3
MRWTGSPADFVLTRLWGARFPEVLLMKRRWIWLFALLGITLAAGESLYAQSDELDAGESAAAAADYQKYCALCHGADREGYVNDNAPSLRSKSLMSSGFPSEIRYTIGYGRRGTPMGAYSEEMGGPMTREEIHRLTLWLKEQSGAEPLYLPIEPVDGDVGLGERTFALNCTKCHGEQGEGVTGPAIGNPAMLSLTTDAFIQYAIENGRDGTEMLGFRDRLSPEEINGITAFLRTRAAGWKMAVPVLESPPPPDKWILNPESPPPDFDLKDGTYVSATGLLEALQVKRRMVLLDTRVTSTWQMAHIEGSVPLPYYDDFDTVTANLPTDGTWIVAYCECPRAAAESVNDELVKQGFPHTAVLWEGIQGWVALGYPVTVGQLQNAPAAVPE